MQEGPLTGWLRADVVPAGYDVFWADHPQLVFPDHRPLAVITPVLSPTELHQLQKMLQACKLPAEGYHHIALDPAKPVAWKQIVRQLAPKTVMTVGIAPAQLGLAVSFPVNKTSRFQETDVIALVSLGVMESQPEVKKQLWNECLKPYFL